MTLAIILIVFAAIGLSVIVRLCLSFSKSLRLPEDASIARQIQPLDVAAFRNLIDPAEREYLRRRLPSAEFREVQRERLRAMAAYVQIAARNATALVALAESSRTSSNPQTAEAARQLIDNAFRLRRNTAYAMFRIRLAWLWPDSNTAAGSILQGYVQLNGTAMLLGRLQNPAEPVRISAH